MIMLCGLTLVFNLPHYGLVLSLAYDILQVLSLRSLCVSVLFDHGLHGLSIGLDELNHFIFI